jgi:hypothetical protein
MAPYLIARGEQSGTGTCPAVYGTSGDHYIVVGTVVTDHTGLTCGVTADEAAVRLPGEVLQRVAHEEFTLPAATTHVELHSGSDVVIEEATSGRPAGLSIDNGGAVVRLVPVGASAADRLAALDKLLGQLSELRVATSEELPASTR